MGGARSLILTFGPVCLIGLCYVTAAPTQPGMGPGFVDGSLERPLDQASDEYRQAAAETRAAVGNVWPTVEHFPFLLTGNLPVERLQQVLNEVVIPSARALSIGYFDHPPERPIMIVLMSDDESYKAALKRFGHSGREEYAGLYSRRDGRILLNLETGDGTLAHELTHALAHADCPDLPEWFDEGLASLHEESVFSADGLRLIGQPNWRDRLLEEAFASNRPPSVEMLIRTPFGRGRAAVDYALARNVCLMLQEREVLGAYYRKCRTRVADDPTGGRALLEILGCRDFGQLEQLFRDWFGERVLDRAG